MTSELPEGWAATTLGEICSKPQYGWTCRAAKEGKIKYVRTTDISDGGVIDWASVPYCEEAPADVAKYRVTENDILVSRAGSVGVSFRIVDVPCDAVFASYLIRFKPLDGIPPKYVEFFLNSDSYWRSISEFSAGIAVPNVNASKLASLVMPLAPLAEQRRIVAKLEKLLGQVDACQQRLEKLTTLLNRLRQSVLAAACSGRLTADWREEHDLDDEWPAEPLNEFFEMRNGKSLVATKRQEGKIPVYGGNGLMGTHNAANAEGLVIVIGRVGAQCGNVHYVTGKVWVTDNAISLQGKKELVPAFYAYFLRSLNLNTMSAGTGQPYVSQEILGPIETPVVSHAEQKQIVRRVAALFALADQLEMRLAQARGQVAKLTPALLARAFAGQLVPQNPKDEPASALLERIKVRS